jgi:nucleoside triphosphatase YtkD
MFKKEFGLEKTNHSQVNSRTSVKILAMIENKYLMLSTNRGDLEFPGGKIEKGETKEDAVKRELLEETGHEVSGSLEYLGQIISRRKDRFDDEKVYEFRMHFYQCNIVYKTSELNLSASEQLFNPTPIVLEKEEIIRINKNYASKNFSEKVIEEITEFVLGIDNNIEI